MLSCRAETGSIQLPLALQNLSGNVLSAGLSVPEAVPDLFGREEAVLLPASGIKEGVEDGWLVSLHQFTPSSAQPRRPPKPVAGSHPEQERCRSL